MRLRWILLAGPSLFFVIAAPFAPALADCVDDCQSATYCDSTMYESGECNTKLEACYQLQCNRPTTAYGAIAYGVDSQAFGFAYDQPNAGSAENVALANCKKHGNDCEIVASFSNSCAAVAAGTNGKYATGPGDTESEAKNNALALCQQKSGGQCEIQAWSCAKP